MVSHRAIVHNVKFMLVAVLFKPSGIENTIFLMKKGRLTAIPVRGDML